jgi:hypothetical protein
MVQLVIVINHWSHTPPSTQQGKIQMCVRWCAVLVLALALVMVMKEAGAAGPD